MITAVFLGCATLVLATPSFASDNGGSSKATAQEAAKTPTKDAKKDAKKDDKSTPAKDEGPAAALAAKVQKYYDGMKDFTADFVQSYTRVALSKTTESTGKVSIKKPGMMRWEYDKPAKKLFVADGTRLWVYEPEEEQVTVDKNFKTSELSSSISFLWGEGKLTETFTTSIGDPTKYGAPKTAPVLELVPKKDATYTKLVLILDPKTSQVDESILYESSGNTNHFKFKNPKLNTNIASATFTFTPPKGVEIINR